jgi:hypothetical protein
MVLFWNKAINKRKKRVLVRWNHGGAMPRGPTDFLGWILKWVVNRKVTNES